MARGAMNEITPWRRRSLIIPPDSWRAWVHLAVWEAWMGMLLTGFLAFGAVLIARSGDRIITFEDLSGCYAPPPVTLPCERIVYRTGALNAAFTALGGMLSILIGLWFLWELWDAVAPKPITDDFLKLLNYSFGRNWRDPRTWPWSRVLWAYGFTFVGVVFAAGAALLIWTALSFTRPVKVPVTSVETSQDFRVKP
jgi:hypothetical protein